MKVRTRLSIIDVKGEGFMGIGLVWLLRRIEKFKSINQAAQDMALSYSKALRILNRMEKNVGHKILVRTRGGMLRGGAALTPFAKSYMEAFARLHRDVTRYAEKRFKRFKKESGA